MTDIDREIKMEIEGLSVLLICTVDSPYTITKEMARMTTDIVKVSSLRARFSQLVTPIFDQIIS
jgi:hypothetical protein